MANSVDPDQTAPIGAVCSGPVLFASILNLSVMLGYYLQQTTSADDIFRYIFFLTLYTFILSLNKDIILPSYMSEVCFIGPNANTADCGPVNDSMTSIKF